MTVTFAIESNPTGKMTLSAACAQDIPDPFAGRVWDSYDEAVAVLVAHKATCEDCAYYGCYTAPVTDVSDDFDVNVSSLNAASLIVRLDIERTEDNEIIGCMSGEDFLGRVLLALGMNSATLDAGVAAVSTGGPGTGRAQWVDCGVEAGYFERVLGELHGLAAEAVRLGRDIVWC